MFTAELFCPPFPGSCFSVAWAAQSCCCLHTVHYATGSNTNILTYILAAQHIFEAVEA